MKSAGFGIIVAVICALTAGCASKSPSKSGSGSAAGAIIKGDNLPPPGKRGVEWLEPEKPKLGLGDVLRTDILFGSSLEFRQAEGRWPKDVSEVLAFTLSEIGTRFEPPQDVEFKEQEGGRCLVTGKLAKDQAFKVRLSPVAPASSPAKGVSSGQSEGLMLRRKLPENPDLSEVNGLAKLISPPVHDYYRKHQKWPASVGAFKRFLRNSGRSTEFLSEFPKLEFMPLRGDQFAVKWVVKSGEGSGVILSPPTR
jgi:hypothetical protein